MVVWCMEPHASWFQNVSSPNSLRSHMILIKAFYMTNLLSCIPRHSSRYPWEKVAIDIMGPFDAAPADCRFVVTLVDYYSKWPEIAFVSRPTTQAVI
ncbi:hypothetical protein QQF64_025953 [Cirrhinus molitorella]|uniref:Integrase catalytic domain-containing protein n=1 Tax=Cirrhinus molitorella TaxID=172907 RepID=A0ABR3NRX7_9TELE